MRLARSEETRGALSPARGLPELLVDGLYHGAVHLRESPSLTMTLEPPVLQPRAVRGEGSEHVFDAL